MIAVVGPFSNWQFFAGMCAVSVAGLAWIAWPWDYRAPEPLPSAAEILAKRRAERAAAGHRPDTYRPPMALVWPGDEAPEGEALYSRWEHDELPNGRPRNPGVFVAQPSAPWFDDGPMPEHLAAFAVALAEGLGRADRVPPSLAPIAANLRQLRALEARHGGEHAAGEAA